MMQKKNVYLTQSIKGRAAEAAGTLMTALMTEKAPTGLPIMEHHYSRSAMIRSFDHLITDIDLLAEMMADVKVKREQMVKSGSNHWCQATDVAGMLVREEGIPWRIAHQIVAILVRLSDEREILPEQVTLELLNEASMAYMGRSIDIDEEQLRVALDPLASVERRTLYGGPAPSEVQSRLEEYEALLSEDQRLLLKTRERVCEGLQQLDAAIEQIITAV